MKRFLTRLLFFLIPVLILVIPPVYILSSSGENFRSIDQEIAGNEKFLIGYAYNEMNYDYLKWKTVSSRDRFSVWALGSSRVLPLRSNMFDSSFYNAGFTISALNDFVPFLKGVPEEKYPGYLIIGLDQWMFNPVWEHMFITPDKYKWSRGFKKNPDATVLKQVWEDLFTSKYTIGLRPGNDEQKRIGLNAVVNNKGFRNDGSMYYGDIITKLLNNDSTVFDYHFSDTQEKIATGGRRFEPSAEISTSTLTSLKELLAFCKEHHIKVFAFLPPFPDQIYDAIRNNNKYAYLGQIYQNIKPIFDQYGYECYDFSNAAACGSNDLEAYDGIHGSELMYQKMLIRILESGSVLNQACNVTQLKNDLEHAPNRYEVYR